MRNERRSNIIAGIILIVVGMLFLGFRVFPGLRMLFRLEMTWPFIVVGVGGMLGLIGLLTGAYEMMIPACIVGGIGGILYWQNLTGYWESWSYIWTLIPGFVGAGIALAGLLKGNGKEIRDGLETIGVSVVMFAIFGSMFGIIPLGQYWPILLIIVGLWQLLKAVIFPRKQE